MSESINEAELGRSKKNATPSEHLEHLLNIGWAPSSLLVRKYIAKYGLQDELTQWQKNNENFALLDNKGNNGKKVTKR
jgi:hypothetical protein